MPTRRSFLKLLGIGAAATVVAPSILEMPAEAVEPCRPVPCPPVEDVRIEAIYRVWEPLNSRNDYTFFAENFEGMCAPLTPYYDFPSGHRPVMDSLPIFTAPRGGIKYHQPRRD